MVSRSCRAPGRRSGSSRPSRRSSGWANDRSPSRRVWSRSSLAARLDCGECSLMPEEASALELVFSGDPALYAIVRLSLAVSLGATLLAAMLGGTARRTAGAEPLPGPTGGGRGAQYADGPATSGGRTRDLSAAVAIRSAGFVGAAVHADGDGDHADHAGAAHHCGADPADRRGSVARVSRRVRGHGRGTASQDTDLAVGRALLARDGIAGRFRPRCRRGGLHHHRRWQHRGFHAHDDDDDCARDLEGQPAAGHGSRAGAAVRGAAGECGGIGGADSSARGSSN